MISVLIGVPLVGALVLWLRRRPRALPFATVVVPCASCGQLTLFSACVGGRCLDCRLAPFFADVAAHVHDPPRAAYHVPVMPRPRRQVSRTCLDAHCRVARVVDIMARSGPTVQLVPPSRICGDCGATLPPRHPWVACTACMGVRVTAAYLARTTRRTVAVSEDELRRIWDRVAW